MLMKYMSLRIHIFQCSSCMKYMSTDPTMQPKVDTKQMLVLLRNKTNFPLINCKEALKATNYNMEKVTVLCLTK